MAAHTHQSKPETVQTQFPQAFAEAQQQSTEALTRANAVLLQTAQAIWEHQVALVRLEAEQMTKLLVPPRFSEGPQAVSDYCSQLHDSSEQLINRLRSVHDLVRGCNWQLLEIYGQGASRNAALVGSIAPQPPAD